VSQPIRYAWKVNEENDFDLMEHPNGEYILYADYTRLKAEVERLTKAGDAMHCFLISYIVENRISSAYLNKLDDGWSNAKEGKQS
jgi:hypothetical protein